MSWRERAKPADDWRSRAKAADVHASSGGHPDSAPTPDMEQPETTPIDPREIEIRQADEEQRKRQLAASLSHGQSLASLPEDERRAFEERGNVGAAAEALSFARGATGPLGSHLDEISGAVKSGSFSGPEYEAEKRKAGEVMNIATRRNPVGPIVGAMMLPNPSSAAGRIGLNAVEGVSEGFGEAEHLDSGSIPAALKKAALSAVLTSLTEGAAKSAKAGGSNLTDRTTAARQALKASGLRGGISSQLAKRGLDDADALDLGRAALDEDLIPFGGSKAAVRDRAARLKEMSGNSYGAQLAAGDAAGKLDYEELTNAMLEPYNNANAVKQGAGAEALNLVDQFERQGRKTPGSFVGAADAKASAWDSANFSDTAKNSPRLYRETMGAGAENITDQLGRIDPDAAAALKVAGKRYGVASDVHALAKEAAQRELENNILGMTELLAGIGGAAAGAPSGSMLASGAGGVAAAFLGGLAKRRGNAAAAVTLNKMQPLGGALDMLGDVTQRAGAAIPEETRSGGLLGEYMPFLNEDEREK